VGTPAGAVVRDLIDHEHQVPAVDVVSTPSDSGAAFVLADVTDFGQTVECLAGVGAVVPPRGHSCPGDPPELMAEVYPSVSYRPTRGAFDTLLSLEKARKLLGYEPECSWRDHIADRNVLRP
jgi:nucleoside-diphosphate-sugar epimerase